MNLHDTTALVTGATRGIGRHLTRHLIAHGARVVAVGRDQDLLDELAAEHGEVHPWQVDLADPAAVDAFVTEVAQRHPGLSVVVNNAGVQTLTDFLGDDDPEALRPVLRREIAINFDAVVALSTGLLPHLRRHPEAAVVNITSGLALAPKRSAPVYCATKAAVRTFSRALRYQCQDAAPHVRVIDAVMPLVDTEMTRGRGRDKISPDQAARAVVDGIVAGTDEIHVGRTRLLPPLLRLSPALAHRVLRDS
ncbi:SDR family oxidoreductase [Lentzea sp. NPDC058450]|uniref:SDR family oxidoreductase n=1 Tax=Lentzea sp. NPDC058450 TaxID=3346505 RepID=UPI00365BC0D0